MPGVVVAYSVDDVPRVRHVAAEYAVHSGYERRNLLRGGRNDAGRLQAAVFQRVKACRLVEAVVCTECRGISAYAVVGCQTEINLALLPRRDGMMHRRIEVCGEHCVATVI